MGIFREPSAYFADLAERLTKAKYIGLPPIDLSIAISYLNRFFDDTLNPPFAIGGQLNPLFFTLNLYASIALFFGLFRWGMILWKSQWSGRLVIWISFFASARCCGFYFFACLYSDCGINVYGTFYERLPPVDEATFSNYPVVVFILLGFSLTLGVVININLRNVREKNEAFGLSYFSAL